MIKKGEKRTQSKPEIVAAFFAHPLTVKIAADLLTADDANLASFFKTGYDAIQVIGGEVTKSAIGFGDPEKLIRDAGAKAPEVVKALGSRIEGLAERIKE